MDDDVPNALFEALDRAEPVLLEALQPVGVVRIEYVVGFVHPYSVWVWLGTATDAERDAMPENMPYLVEVSTVLQAVDLPPADVGEIGTAAQSQETVDRDYEGNWFYALR